jgi:hypothetical protein
MSERIRALGGHKPADASYRANGDEIVSAARQSISYGGDRAGS